MPIYNPETQEYEETPEEKQLREQQAAAAQQQPQIQVGPAPAPAGPVAPANAQYLAQNESGNNPNIGYHDQSKSTAYGTYGITAPQYQEIQRANPAFANRPITSLTPQDQTTALGTSNDVYARQLQAKGIPEVTPGMINAAHFTGAGGLHHFLTTGGEVLPQIAAANGGEENARRIINQRLMSGASPASGAVAPVAPQPAPEPAPAAPVAPEPGLPGVNYGLSTGQSGLGMRGPEGQTAAPMGPGTTQESPLTMAQNQFQQSQDNIDELMKLKADTNLPEHIRQRSGDRAYELMNQQYKKQEAEAKAKELVDSGDQNKIARVLSSNPKDEEGSWLKMIMLGFISPQLAGAEAVKLGLAPTKWATAMDADGNTGLIRYRADGLPIEGTKADGTAMTKQELTAYASQGAAKASDTSHTLHQAVINGEVHTISQRRLPNGKIQYRDDTSNAVLPNAPAGMTALGRIDPVEQKALKAKETIETKLRKANEDIKLAGGTPHTEEYIQQQGNAAYSGLTGRQFGGAATGAPVAAAPPPPGAPPVGTMGAPVAATAQVATPTPAVAATPVKSVAQKIADYELPMPSPSMRDPGSVSVRNEVLKLNPGYDGQKFKENQSIIKDFTPGGTAGKSIVAMGTAVNHISDLRPLVTALHNGDLPGANAIYNNIKKWTGDPNVTNIEAVGPAVAAEIQKTFVSSGGGTGSERDELAKAFGSAKSPQQLEGAIKMYENLMVGKVDELRKQYDRTGRKDFYTNIATDPRIKEMVDHHNAQRAASENKPLSGSTTNGIKFKVITQ